VNEPVSHCRGCNQAIWWRLNPSGKRQPMDYDLVTGQPTQTPHHATCPQVQRFRRQAEPEAVARTAELPWWFR